jgi:hypothetical protein
VPVTGLTDPHHTNRKVLKKKFSEEMFGNAIEGSICIFSFSTAKK